MNKVFLALHVSGNRPARRIVARNERAARRRLPNRGFDYLVQELTAHQVAGPDPDAGACAHMQACAPVIKGERSNTERK